MRRKRKKNVRLRATQTHGWGAKKKHRGAGNRGGRGNAGSGKRGDAKKPSFWKDRSYYKSKGFTSLKKPIKAINIDDLKRFDATKINLKKEGYDKLLSLGTPNRKYEITVPFASAKAKKKIEDAGGSVSGLKEKKVKKRTATKKPKKEEPADEPESE